MAKKKAKKKTSRKRKISLEDRVDDFGEEIERIGEEFEENVERGESRIGKKWHETFGIIGPLIISIFSIVIFIIFLWFLGFFACITGIVSLNAARYFLASNLGIFFMLFLLFGYAKYFKRLNPKAYRPIWPLLASVKTVVVVWIVASIVIVSGIGCQFQFVKDIAICALNNLFWIFAFVAALGYLIVIISTNSRCEKELMHGGKKMHKKRKGTFKGKRLYRSGRDRVLGGVCGGLGEYFNVDPVIIRFLWVIGTLISMGFGLAIYVIAWIIIPRNPKDKWE